MKKLVCVFLVVIFLISSLGVYPTREAEVNSGLLWFLVGVTAAVIIINGIKYDTPHWWYTANVDEIVAEFVNPQGKESKEEALTGILYHAQRDSSIDLSLYDSEVLKALQLNNVSNINRRAFVKFFGFTQYAKAVPELTRLFTTTDDEELRIDCVKSLGAIGDKTIAPLLHNYLERGLTEGNMSQNFTVAISAALGLLGDESLLPIFKSMLQDHNWPLRYAAAVGLSYLGLGREALEQALVKEGNNETKIAMLDALGKIGDASSVNVIVGFLDQTDIPKWIGGKPISTYGKYQSIRICDMAKEALINIGEDGIKPLKQFLIEEKGNKKEKQSVEDILFYLESNSISSAPISNSELNYSNIGVM